MLAWAPPKSGYFEAIMDPCWHPLKQLWINFSTCRDLVPIDRYIKRERERERER